MTTQTAILSSDALGHITTPCPQLLTVEWVAGTEQCHFVNELISNSPGGATDLFMTILRYVKTYMLGPEGENFDAWRGLFGSSHAFIPATAMTLGCLTLQHSPYHLHLWNGASPIVRIASFNYIELGTLSLHIQNEAKAMGFKVVFGGLCLQGLLTVFSG